MFVVKTSREEITLDSIKACMNEVLTAPYARNLTPVRRMWMFMFSAYTDPM